VEGCSFGDRSTWLIDVLFLSGPEAAKHAFDPPGGG
jgi:hypothetical protein